MRRRERDGCGTLRFFEVFSAARRRATRRRVNAARKGGNISFGDGHSH